MQDLYSIDQNPVKRVLDDADHTDHTDHTDQESLRPEISRS